MSWYSKVRQQASLFFSHAGPPHPLSYIQVDINARRDKLPSSGLVSTNSTTVSTGL